MKPNKFIKKIRHNIFIYMFWDIPQYKAYKENNRWERVKYILQVMFVVGGVSFANVFYTSTLDPPNYKDLRLTEGRLVEVIRSTGRGGARKIRVVDQNGQEMLFPNNTNYLAQISDAQATELEKECLGKPIVVLWKEESRLLFGSLIDAWEIKNCNSKVLIDYEKRVEIRTRYEGRYRKMVYGGLIVSLIFFVPFLLNYKDAKSLLNSKYKIS